MPHLQREGSLYNNGERLGNIWQTGESSNSRIQSQQWIFFQGYFNWIYHDGGRWLGLTLKTRLRQGFHLPTISNFGCKDRRDMLNVHWPWHVVTMSSHWYPIAWIIKVSKLLNSHEFSQSSWRGWPVILYSGSLCKTNEEDKEIQGKFSLSLWNWALTCRKELQKLTCQILHQSWLCSQRSGRKGWQDKRLAWSSWRIRKLTRTKICTSTIQACWQSFSFKIYHDLSFKANKKL